MLRERRILLQLSTDLVLGQKSHIYPKTTQESECLTLKAARTKTWGTETSVLPRKGRREACMHLRVLGA